MKETLRAFIVGSYRSFFTIAGITLSLMAAFMMFNLLLVSYSMYNDVRKDIRFEIFPKGDPKVIRERLKIIGGIKDVHIISGEQARREFLKFYPQFKSLVNELGDEVFYTIIRAYPDEHWKESGFLDMMAEKIKLVEGVGGVYYGKKWLESASTFFKVILTMVIIVMVITISITLVISFYTVRFVVSNRKVYVDILRLAGVSPFRLRIPYIILSIIYSLTSWILATSLSSYILNRFGTLSKFYAENIVLYAVFLFLVMLSCVMGALQALRDIERGVP